MRPMRQTILVVDDHAEFRGIMRALLTSEGFDVVAEAADGHGAIAAARRLRPDVVLLDIQLPDIDGFAVAEELGRESSPPRVILVSSRDHASYAPQLAVAPVMGFIAKSRLSGAAIRALVG
jgi:DNA-binding NarL/FixJ family response regulator